MSSTLSTRLAAASRWRIADVLSRPKQQKNCSSRTFPGSITSSLPLAVAHITCGTNSPLRRKISANIYDLVEFLHDILRVSEFPWAKFDHKVALHTSCSAIRGLGLASMSERVHDPKFSKPKNLLERVPGIQFDDFERPDECCGFGGTFSVTEEAVAAKMGYDKLEFISKAGADYIVSSDMSCLMHMQGCAHRLGT